jgi:hypothetical protein
MSLPPIVAKVTADTTGLDKGLAGAQAKLASFGKAATIAGAAVGAAAVGLVALTKASMANIDALAKQARSLGLTVSAFQKMSLVANEAGVATEKLSGMLGLMQRNIVALQEGAAKQTDTFKALGVALEDLQGLAPDEQFARIAEKLNAIEDPAKKTALAMEVFGRSGREAINMLDGYGDAVANAAKFQATFGISVGETAAQGVERANDAVGRLGMVMEGLGNRLAVTVSPAIENTANGLIKLAEVILGITTDVQEFFGTLEVAKALLGEDVFNRMLGNPADVAEHAPTLKGIANEMMFLKIISGDTVSQLAKFANQLDKMGEIGAADVIRQIAADAETARTEFDSGAISIEQFGDRLLSALERAQGVAVEIDGVNGKSLSGIIGRMASLGDTIAAAAAEALRLKGLLPGELGGDSGYAIPVSNVGRGGAGPGGPLAGSADLAELQAGGGTIRNMPADVKKGGGGGGGGGGLADQLAQRLEVLMEGLQTEAEMVATWYAEQQMTLEEALAAKMLTEAEYMEARERLEKEHQDRLGSIREMANQSNLSLVLGAGQEILQAIGATNKKALKVAKVFGAAQALISTYQGAAEALKLPFPKNLAAAAAVIAKGIGFVQAIKGMNEGGGAPSAGAGGGAGGGAAAQQNVQTLNFTIQNDPFGFGQNLVRQLATQLNEAGRNGSSIRATVAQ